MRPFVFVGGGLGDVALQFYVSNTYEIIESRTEPLWVVCYSHNPSALEFFRFHPNHRKIVLFDMGHLYMALLRDPSVNRKEINRTIFEACGLIESEQLTKPRELGPIGHFHAPDNLKDARGHIVLHPFGRGWGDWPLAACDSVRMALRAAAPSTRVFVIAADYVSTDGCTKHETFPCELPNVMVLKNLSAPAAFTLVATASRFIGTMSALSQVAAFENVPSIILHPARCSDFKPPFSNYSKAIWRGNGIGIAYDSIAPGMLEKTLEDFLRDPSARPVMREAFSAIDPRALGGGSAEASPSK
jgi:hypothetical protein